MRRGGRGRQLLATASAIWRNAFGPRDTYIGRLIEIVNQNLYTL